jgi:hypothetical protein
VHARHGTKFSEEGMRCHPRYACLDAGWAYLVLRFPFRNLCAVRPAAEEERASGGGGGSQRRRWGPIAHSGASAYGERGQDLVQVWPKTWGNLHPCFVDLAIDKFRGCRDRAPLETTGNTFPAVNGPWQHSPT